MPIPLRDDDKTLYYKYGPKALDLAREKGIHVQVFAEELRRLCKTYGYNFPGMFVQAWHETDGFRSDAWINRKNPAGIKNATGTAYQKYYNGVDAARAFVVHMSAYNATTETVNDFVKYRYLDERYMTAFTANFGKRYTTFNDLTGRWAEDPQYGELIERRFYELLG